ncbi:MAG: 30S ribosomal protein S16 [Bacillota bacterium]|nr:30S ribosomal protein S16 [Bacillota bacterium]
MATKIRLKRMGGKKKPFYRVVIADAREPRGGRVIEEIGTYDPGVDPAAVHVDADRARDWLSKGAQPTDRVRTLLGKLGVLS